MKRKIAISSTTLTAIVAALVQYGEPELAKHINNLYEKADPVNDGPEVGILRIKLLTL